jgi:hypothetical protein
VGAGGRRLSEEGEVGVAAQRSLSIPAF